MGGITQLLQKPSDARAQVWVMNLVRRDKTFSEPVNWTTRFSWLHFLIGAIAIVFLYWKASLWGVSLWVASLGIGMGYHRLLTTVDTRHRSGWSIS
jgi:hypothetical protein